MLRNLLGHGAHQILQEAVQSELQAAQLYRHLANQCQRLGYFGAAKFFRKESLSELDHYETLSNYFNVRGSVAEVPGISAETDVVPDLESALSIAYDVEIELGVKYSHWYTSLLTIDPTTADFLSNFLEIQRNSIGEYGDLISRLELAEGDKAAIMMLDNEMGA